MSFANLTAYVLLWVLILLVVVLIVSTLDGESTQSTLNFVTELLRGSIKIGGAQ